MNDTNKKKFDLTIAPLWFAKSGSGNLQVLVTDEIKNAIANIEVGGRLTVKLLKDEQRKKETSPHAYLEAKTKEDVESFEASKKF